MQLPSKNIYTIYEGTTLIVEWYYTEDGHMPGYEYYRTLNEDEKVRFFQIVKYYADGPLGTILPRTLLNIEDNEHKIYALKPFSRRFFFFTVGGGKIIITNGYQKSSQKMTKKGKEKLKIAIKYRYNYLERIEGGIYYEKDSTG